MKLHDYTPDEIISIRAKQLGVDELAQVSEYLDTPKELRGDREGYVQDLYQLTLSQLVTKAGLKLESYPQEVEATIQLRLELVAERLTLHFLKRKLERIAKQEKFQFTPGSEVLDPHHHLNSIYVREHPHLLNLLPNFSAIYTQLRELSTPQHLEDQLRTQTGILTDVQYLGRPPKGGFIHPEYLEQRLNPTIGYVRGNKPPDFKEGFITQHAERYGTCRCCDFCGAETRDSWEDLQRYLSHAIRHQSEIIRVHIGETLIPSHGKHNVEVLFRLLEQKRQDGEITDQTIRIGHGTHMGIAAMKEAAQHRYFVEACLSSNKETGIITKRHEYPLGVMLLLDVPVMIGTDGGDAYYTDLMVEYTHARKVLKHFLKDVAAGKEEVVQLPNGDQLCFGHVKTLFQGIEEAQDWDDDKLISYRDLKLIEPVCQNKISMQTLIANMNTFKGTMFPQHAAQVAVAADSEEVKVLVESEIGEADWESSEQVKKIEDLQNLPGKTWATMFTSTKPSDRGGKEYKEEEKGPSKGPKQ